MTEEKKPLHTESKMSCVDNLGLKMSQMLVRSVFEEPASNLLGDENENEPKVGTKRSSLGRLELGAAVVIVNSLGRVEFGGSRIGFVGVYTDCGLLLWFFISAQLLLPPW